MTAKALDLTKKLFMAEFKAFSDSIPSSTLGIAVDELKLPALELIEPYGASDPYPDILQALKDGIEDLKEEADLISKIDTFVLKFIFGEDAIPEQVVRTMNYSIRAWYLKSVTSLYESLDIYDVYDDCDYVFKMIELAAVESVTNGSAPNEGEAAFISKWTPTVEFSHRRILQAPDLGPKGIFQRLEVKYKQELKVHRWRKVFFQMLNHKLEGKNIILANYDFAEEDDQDLEEIYELGTDGLDEDYL